MPGLSSDLLIGFTSDVSRTADYAVLQTIAVSGLHFMVTKDGSLLVLLLFIPLVIMHESLSVLRLRRPAQPG